MKASVKGKSKTSQRRVAVRSQVIIAFNLSHLSFFTNLVSHKVSFFSLPGNLKWCSTPCAASLKRQEEHTVCSILSFHLSLGSAMSSVLASPQCSNNSKSPHWPEERWLLAALPYLRHCFLISGISAGGKTISVKPPHEGSFASRPVRHRSED